MITFWPCVLVRSSHTDKQKTQRRCPLFDLNVASEVQMRNFKQIFESAAQSKLGRFFSLLPPTSLLDPGEGCVIVCFHFPWYEASCRPELCVWRWGRFFFRGVGLLLETKGFGRRPFAWCLEVSTAERKGEKECGCILCYWILFCVHLLVRGIREL